MDLVAAGHPRRLLTLAAFMVVSCGLALGRVVVVPVLLTVFIVIVTAPLYQGLKRRGLPVWAVRVLVMVGLLAALGTLFAILAIVLRGLLARLPLYEAQYDVLRSAVDAFLLNTALGQAPTGLVPTPQQVAEMLQAGLRTLLVQVGPACLLVFLVQDALEDADALPELVPRLLPSGARLWENWQLSAGFVRTFMAMRTLEGLLKGVAVYAVVRLLGIDFPLAWALVAFLTTYLPPSIGQPLALLGPAIMAVTSAGAWAAAAYVVIYPLIEWLCDQLFAPYLDASVRISNFQSSVAVFYWTLVLGPLGAFLAVPLTVMVRAVLASFEESWPMAVLMYHEGDRPQAAPLPEERHP